MNVVDNRLLPGRTTADTSKLWPELARRTTLLLPVVLAVAAGRAVRALAAGATHLRRARGADGLFVRGGDDLGRKVQPEDITAEYEEVSWQSTKRGTHHSRR